MNSDWHLIYITIIVILTLSACVAAFVAKDAIINNRELRGLALRWHKRWERSFYRLGVYTCASCIDQKVCKYAWNRSNLLGTCIKKDIEEEKNHG